MGLNVNTISEGDLVRLIYSPCQHYGERNTYIGFEGVVKIDNFEEGRFSLFSGKSWLTNLNTTTDKFKIIKKNTTGLFSIKNTDYYTKEAVLHKPYKCNSCGFIPVEYMKKGVFSFKYYCANCY